MSAGNPERYRLISPCCAGLLDPLVFTREDDEPGVALRVFECLTCGARRDADGNVLE